MRTLIQRTTRAITLMALMLAVAVLPAFAQHGQHAPQMSDEMMQQMMDDPVHHAGMMTHMLPEMREELGLSDEQVQSLREHRSRAMEAAAAHMEEAMAYRRQLQSMMHEETADMDRMEELVRQMAERRADAQAAMMRAHMEMRDALTPEQRQRMQSMEPGQMQQMMMRHMPMENMMMSMHREGVMDCPAHMEPAARDDR